MKALRVMGRSAFGRGAWMLAGLMLLGGGGATVASAQDVVAAGATHSCAVIGDQLQCWGSNVFGELGDGTTTASMMPRPVVGLAGTVSAVAAGFNYTCAIADGGLYCWGYNASGQLGTGNTDPSAVPIEIFPPGSGVTAVAAHSAHTCAVIGAGLRCWGWNANGQLGTGNNDPSSTPMTVFAAGTGVSAVATGSAHSCAVINGEVRCWGYNGSGQLGTNNTDPTSTPVLVSGPITNAVGIGAGSSHSCAVLDTGGVLCWGDNSYGELGNSSYAISLVPTTVYTQLVAPPQVVPMQGVTAIATGNSHNCGMTDGGVYCWGRNEDGQLGLDSTADSNLARPVGLSYAPTGIAAGQAHTCALAAGSVFCWGSDGAGQLGNAADTFFPLPTLSMTGFSHVSAGWAHGCATSAGGAYCWGSNHEGQLGTGTFSNSAAPQPVSGLESNIELITAGLYHSCAWKNFGGGSVHCWGDDQYGQLGNGIFDTTGYPTPVAVAGLGDTISLDAGDFHTCAVSGSSGGVRCWGLNEAGQLGNGTNANSAVPVYVEIGSLVQLNGATAVTAGGAHSCAVVNGGARCWGDGHLGQLGNGSTPDAALRAVAVNGLGSSNSGVTMLSAGGAHTCGLVNGGVQCWGWNFSGQLGNGTNDDSTVPVPVPGLDSGVDAVASGGAHTCAVRDGGVQCWGDNSSGQLGDGTFVSSNVAVTAGSDYTCATGTAEGEVWCWGSGMYGRLANGKLGYMDAPGEVSIFGHGFEPVRP